MLVFQHPQLEERKVSRGLGHSLTTLPGPGKRAGRGQEIPPRWTPPPPKKSGQDKIRGLIPLLNFPDSSQDTFKLPEPHKHQGRQVGVHHQPSCPFRSQSACLFISTFKKTKISKARLLWEQPLASCPDLCNQPVLTPTGRRRQHWRALWSTRPCPRVAAETNCCSTKSSRKPLAAPGGSGGWLLPSTRPAASVGGFPLPFG